jgi:hypothetical protein
MAQVKEKKKEQYKLYWSDKRHEEWLDLYSAHLQETRRACFYRGSSAEFQVSTERDVLRHPKIAW